ncbi:MULTISPECIES: cytochrome c biogenesis protein CcsA [unclassified Pseudonocardia]|uniref:cytochrome c biogenesis protein CcsA n=1 Tax=unclassified Pseudonocardia TaxID=2619320 RepID=UPI00095E2162|nr:MULTISPECIES: cytochrome c biogenesis protein CcsA [unclassified Pseudonocardia]MBN9098031.1 cytochrome c biogenesis protein CcsA [Pseudonocardia sp.]OJY54428.1 MAG: cytochrome C biogenesis protein [Pseudonocardia sp. 73-21]
MTPDPHPGSGPLFGRRLPAVTAAAVVAALAAAMMSPPDYVQGELVRLMYVHVPAAWAAYLSYAVTLAASVGWLRRRRPGLDRLAAASAEVGVFFTGLAIALGSIWGRPTWGVWWAWDARLVTTALLFFVYLGYLALRRAIPDPVLRARRSAVFGVVAFAQVPLVHFSVLWWRTLHQPPTVLRPSDPAIDHTMLIALLLGVLAFTLLHALFVRTRCRIAAARDALDADDETRYRPVAGAAVSAPEVGSHV